MTQAVAPPGSNRTLDMDSGFFVGYKQTALRPNEVLVSVFIPFTKKVSISVYSESSVSLQ